jgi:multiple sugar transport system permease protein
LCIPIAAFGGYAFSRYRAGGRPLQFVVIGTQMLPGVVLILPIFVIFNTIKLTDSLIGMILAYMAFNLPFLVWILMGFFEGIPTDIEEAAAIDGLSPFGIVLRIIIPISTPGIMSSAILSFIMCWNEFLFALVLTGGSTKTVPVALAAMITHRGVLIGKMSAGTVIAIIPMIIISLFVKKYLVKGLTLGAIK